MGETSIEWTDKSWPIAAGCKPKSAGCLNCYAARLTATRLRNHPAYQGLAEMKHGVPKFTGEVRFLPDRLDEPLRWKKGCRVFVADMSDLFDLEDEQIASVFGVMATADQHVYQVLTKNEERLELLARLTPEWWAAAMSKHLPCSCTRAWYDRAKRAARVLPNVELGVSVENRRDGVPRIAALRRMPAARRFLSVEPLLEDLGDIDLTGIDYVIIGAESGPGAREAWIRWIRSLIACCRRQSVLPFVKQVGAKPIAVDRWDMTEAQFRAAEARGWTEADGPVLLKLRKKKGNDPAEWPEDLRVRELPGARVAPALPSPTPPFPIDVAEGCAE